jgi:uncharacterized protein (TIGR03067 family)
MINAALPILVGFAVMAAKDGPAIKAEFDKLQGEWVLASTTRWSNGKRETRGGGGGRIIITGDRWEPKRKPTDRSLADGYMRLNLNPGKSPKWINQREYEPPDNVPHSPSNKYNAEFFGVYQLDGDTLTCCWNFAAAGRPKGLQPDEGEWVLVWKRPKK